jgi:mono/diheme cytochrome c family protein
MDELYYPINDFGPVMKGLVIGGLGIVHVFLAQFAIGGGMLACWIEWLHGSGRSKLTRGFLDRYFKVLVLVSFVLGAVTGVAMWFTSIQISPRTIGMMVVEFHWIWAIEWTFFCLEVVAGYCFYRYGAHMDHRSRLGLLITYSLAAWFSLFWINGILSWQLTPGEWLNDQRVLSGFLNPGFWPSLIFRTITSLTIASLSAAVMVNLVPDLSREDRQELIQYGARLLLPMLAMPLLGLWYFGSLPEDSKGWLMGGSVAMSMFLTMAVGASVLIGAYATFGIWKQKLFINGATASLLLTLAFAATAGGEFVREGVRKPYTIRNVLYSNSMTPDEVRRLREIGCTTNDPWPVKDADLYPTEQLKLGMHVFRVQCSICHTLDGANGLHHLSSSWSTDQKRMNIAQLQRTKTFMPPFAGTPAELEALVQLLEWHHADRPDQWDGEESDQVLQQIRQWMDEAPLEATTTADTGPPDSTTSFAAAAELLTFTKKGVH